MNDLSQRLKDGVPPAPDPTDLSSIAVRAATAGRRRRTQRRLASVAAVAVVAAGGVLLPRVLGDGPPDVAQRSEPACVAEADAPLAEIGSQEATWVRFCEVETEGPRARHPRGVVTGSLAMAVVRGWRDWLPERQCSPETPPVPSRLFRVQVGLADGSVVEIDGDTACIDDHLLFLQLQTPVEGSGIRRDEVVEPLAVTCPDGLDPTAVSRDGADATLLAPTDEDPDMSAVPLLPGQVSAVDVCAYTGEGERRTLVDQWRSSPISDIRATATTGYTDGRVACGPQPDATSYVVVLQGFLGTVRSFTLDVAACGEMRAAIGTPAVDTYLGVASDELVRVVRDSRP